MSSQTNTTVLITGANRGIGRGLAEAYLQRPNTTVIAAVRTPSSSSSQSFLSAPKSSTSQLIIVPLDSSDPHAASAAIKTLTSEHNITHLDIVIANAGISDDGVPIAKLKLETIQKHVDTNAYGVLTLFQAAVELLEKAKEPKFVAVSSALGTIGGMELRAAYPYSAYGVSKAMVNFFARRIHFEHERIVALALDPGFVQTDMGNAGAKAAGLEKAFDTVEDVVNGTIAVIDKATKQETSGRFVAAGPFAGVDGGKDFPF